MGDQQEKGDLRSQGAAVQGSGALTEPQRLWVEALRSGKYPQAMGRLAALDDEHGTVAGYCCLGVACEIALARGLTLAVEADEDGDRTYDDQTGALPAKVQDWLGLRTCTGEFRPANRYMGLQSLSQRNDEGDSFTEIADLIESRPKGLFA